MSSPAGRRPSQTHGRTPLVECEDLRDHDTFLGALIRLAQEWRLSETSDEEHVGGDCSGAVPLLPPPQGPVSRCVATTNAHRQCERPEVLGTRRCWQHKHWRPYAGWTPGPAEPFYDDRGAD